MDNLGDEFAKLKSEIQDAIELAMKSQRELTKRETKLLEDVLVKLNDLLKKLEGNK